MTEAPPAPSPPASVPATPEINLAARTAGTPNASSSIPRARARFQQAREAQQKAKASPTSTPPEATRIGPVDPPKAPDAPKPAAVLEPPKTPSQTAPAAPESPKPAPAAKDPPASKEKTGEDLPDIHDDLDPKNPPSWKFAKHYQRIAKTQETELATLRERLASMSDQSILQTRAEKADARVKELEGTVRELDYVRSDEFKTKFFQPYADAWKSAKAELAELTITDAESGQTRVAAVTDLARVVNLPLGEARRVATELFGDSAEDVMAHRRKIRDLAEAQQRALDDETKNSAAKQSERETRIKTIRETNANLWRQFNDEDTKRLEFLQPREGDEEWNGNLTLAREMVDGAWSVDVDSPQLSPEDRNDVLRKRAAIRGRAIGFSSLKLENKRLKAQIAERDATIASYKTAEPSAGEGPAQNGKVVPGTSARSRALAEMRQMAR